MKKKQGAPGRVPFWRQPRFRYGSMSTLLLCLCIAIPAWLLGQAVELDELDEAAGDYAPPGGVTGTDLEEGLSQIWESGSRELPDAVGKGLRSGGLLLAVVLLCDTLEEENGWRMDFSFNELTTQSETTEAILASLPYDVHIYALFTPGSEDLPLMELLNRYASASDRVTWEQTSVTLNPTLTTRFRGTSDQPLTNDSLIVSCEATGRYKILSPDSFISLSLDYEAGVYEIAGLTYEKEITSAIAYVTREDIPRVMILQGHGELDQGTTAVLADFLTSNNFEVVYFELTDADVTLEPEDLLLILSPQRDFMPTELEAITDFAAAGGNLFITCDYTDDVSAMPNYQSLLRSYGFQPLDGVVIAGAEETGTYYDGLQIALLPYMQSSAATMDLVENNQDTLLLTGARAFAQPEEGDQNLITQVVLSSGYQAYLRDFSDGAETIEQQDGDPLGPFALALLSQRITEAGNVSKAFVLGCSTVLTSSQVYVMTDAQQFILTMCTYLSGAQPVQLDIMAKTALRPALSTDSLSLGIALVVAVPLTVLVAALAVLLPRRHR